MRRLFTIDLKDYNPEGKKFYRSSVRGIISNDNGDIAIRTNRSGYSGKLCL